MSADEIQTGSAKAERAKAILLKVKELSLLWHMTILP
jgi:hypothetical protein